MSIVIEIFSWLFIETIVGFIFYSTGCLLLKVLTFGKFEIEFKDLTAYKGHKSTKVNLACLLGIVFYVFIIILIATLNN
ncbi:hypothetical protein GCM10011501_22950 [Thalassotalea profundi]|uniref:Nitrite reductase n=1 Tax=Thalassotalea profundi TaxID=2036687 RepID=A0ABQ3IXL1_9GAMM|nr:hypothetical protein GCM10011501_22950 [Thalassotalea profundi]